MMIQNVEIKYYYYDGSINKVDNTTKTAVKSAINKLQTKIKPEFFNNLKVQIASDFSNIPKNCEDEFGNYLRQHESEFSGTKGITTDGLNKTLFIQESAFKFNKLINLLTFKSLFTANQEIEHATAHELGHLFDYEGADKTLKAEQCKILQKYNDTYEEVDLTPKEEKIIDAYMKNNGFSDKKEFKEAIKKDLTGINFKDLKGNNLDITITIGDFYSESLNAPTLKDIENADSSRMELFAQLFSYATGFDDGHKDFFLKYFPNTYKVVQNLIGIYSAKRH